jgi:hypothetical protein
MRQARFRSLVLFAGLTGWNQPADRARSMLTGFDRRLVRPVDIAQLTDVLASHSWRDDNQAAPGSNDQRGAITITCSGDSKLMVWHNHAERELDHIKAAVTQLEHLSYSDGALQNRVVMQPDYWRKRIREVLAHPHVSHELKKQGLALLERLDHLHSESHDRTG